MTDPFITPNRRCPYCGRGYERMLDKCPSCGTKHYNCNGQPLTPRPGKRYKPTLDTIEQTGAYFG